MHQSLAEGGFAGDDRAIVILQRAGNNLRGRSRAVIHQHHDGIFAAPVAMSRPVGLFRKRAATLRNNHLALFQKLVTHRNRLTQQSTRIPAQIENQTIYVAEVIQARRKARGPWSPGNW